MKYKYSDIFEDLKGKIEDGTYKKEDFLPSESAFIEQYGCSRYSLRSALAQLVAQGYVQSIHGKGVQVIYTHNTTRKFLLGGISSFREFAEKNGITYRTHVRTFAEMEVDEDISILTSFPVGEEYYYIERVRYIDDKALIIDRNYYRKKYIPGLTKQIAETSVFSYFEKTLHMKIGNIQRRLSVERTSASDQNILDLDGLNCVFQISSNTYSDKGDLFEYTESSHHPDYFIFRDQIANRLL